MDDSIPNRAKKGQKSKKAVRDEVRVFPSFPSLFSLLLSRESPPISNKGVADNEAQEGVRESLKNLSKASGWTVGKWYEPLYTLSYRKYPDGKAIIPQTRFG
jgi:hypothetical protein